MLGGEICRRLTAAGKSVRALVRDDKSHQIYSIIQTNQKSGMATMNQSLATLYNTNQITYEDAISSSCESEELERRLLHRR